LGAVLGAMVFSACGGAKHHDGEAGITADARDLLDAPGQDTSILDVPADAPLALDGPTASHPDFVTSLPSIEAFYEMLGREGDIKVLGQVDGAVPPVPELGYPCVFQDTLRFPGHAPFLRKFPELAGMSFDAYLTMVMKRSSRVLWGGALQFFPAVPHPITGVNGILGYFLYSDANEVDALTDDEILAFDARIKACVPFARDLLVLVGMDEDQAARFDAQRERLTARGVSVLPAGQLRPGFSGNGYSLGESFGTLNLVPAGEAAHNYGPRDIVIGEVASAEMSAVAGLVTATAQDPEGQLNLSLRAGKIPNGQVSDIFRNGVLPLLNGRPVRIVVRASEIQIAPAPPSATDFWKNRDS
jgi:hypothetical protein